MSSWIFGSVGGVMSRAMPTTVMRSWRRSTGTASWRASSASSREASEMSLIRRSRRRMSCWMMPVSRALACSVLASGSVSTALRSEVSGFFDLVRHVGGETLDRVDAVVERAGHVADRLAQMPDLVAAMAVVGDLRARAEAASARDRRHRRAGGAERRSCPARRNERSTVTPAATRKTRTIASRSAWTISSMSPPCVERRSAPRSTNDSAGSAPRPRRSARPGR